MVLTDSATGSPQTVAISGNGLAVSATATLSPANLSFGNQPVGLASVTQNVVHHQHRQCADQSHQRHHNRDATPGDFSQTELLHTRSC